MEEIRIRCWIYIILTMGEGRGRKKAVKDQSLKWDFSKYSIETSGCGSSSGVSGRCTDFPAI
jgi:hypothetical protein